MNRLAFLTLTSVLAASPALYAQSGEAGASLLVISKTDHALAIVDPVTLKVKAKAPVGEDPHEVTASADGRTAWVSIYGGGAYHTLSVIDLKALKAEAPIDLGPLSGPHGLTFVGSETWFTAEGAKVIGRLDPATRKVDFVMGTGQNRTHMIYVSPDEKHIITTNVASATVSFIDQVPVQEGPPPGAGGPPPGGGPRPGAASPPAQPQRDYDWNETVVHVGPGSEGFDLSPDGREVWTANATDGTLSVINRDSKTVVATVQANAKGANRLKFTLDGKYVLVSLLDGPDLVVLDAHTRSVVKRVPIGHGAAGILMEPNGRRAFVACGPDNYVAVIDLSKMEVAGHFDVGGNPDGMAWVAAK